MSNPLTFRRAVESDAHGIAEVARRVSAKQYILEYLDQQGIERSHLSDQSVDVIKNELPSLISDEQRDELDRQLSESGFLLYPLDADNAEVPNYQERTRLADHFWVASDENDQVIGFMMAYTFGKMDTITKKTANDVSVLDHFLHNEDVPHDVNGIYIQQVATLPDSQHDNVMSGLMCEALQSNNRGNSSFAVAEIAQIPHRNVASSGFFEKNGFRMVSTRPKDNGARVSGTFMQTFPMNP